jgi:phosphomannomutase
MEQVPMDILKGCREVYCESGSDVYFHDSDYAGLYAGLIGSESNYDKHWDCPVELRNMLMTLLNGSDFPATMRTGNHIEIRKSMVNFSVIGRNATFYERCVYTLWDKDRDERGDYARQIEELFPELTANVAGEIGIDIHPKGRDKSQVLPQIKQWPDGNEPIIFFGDKTEKGGNDYPLANVLDPEKDTVHQVNSWQDTYEILKKLLTSA